MSTTIQVRRATGAAWTAANPTLAEGEIGLNLTTGTFKIGDGVTAWASLAYQGGGVTDHGALTGLADDDHPQYIKHSLATAASDFLVASGVGAFVKKTLAEVKTILGLGTAAYTASTDYAAAAKGVTNGDSHDHAGGDGAQVDHGGLGGLGDDDHTQYTRHALATAANDFLVASGSGTFVKKTLAQTQAILGALIGTRVTLGGDQTSNAAYSTTKSDCAGLSFACDANSTYIFEGVLIVTTSNTAEGIWISATGPASSIHGGVSSIPYSTAGSNIANPWNADDVGLPSSALPFTEGNIVHIRGYVKTAASSGNWQLRFAMEVAGAYSVTIRAGSTINYQKVA
jgi:hypothetical protein